MAGYDLYRPMSLGSGFGNGLDFSSMSALSGMGGLGGGVLAARVTWKDPQISG